MRAIFLLFLVSSILNYSEVQTQKKLTLSDWGIERGRIAGMREDEREFLLDRISMQKDMDYCFKRERELLNQYKSTLREASEFDSKAYKEFYKESNGYCIGFYKQSAPFLYFRFASTISDVYELESITIETISYDPHESFSPIGFLDKEASYDITLSHRPIKKTYTIKNRLIFSYNGMAYLTFRSDDSSPEGILMTPRGLYHINITFTFNVKGIKESVSTGAFWLDV
jgi:hypothetical protein